MADEIECRDCQGHGWRLLPFSVDESAPCPDCNGEGWRAPTDDELADMAERQAEDAASGEPPVTVQEQYIDAWTQKQALRR